MFKIEERNEEDIRTIDFLDINLETGETEGTTFTSIKITQKVNEINLRFARSSEGKNGETEETRKTKFDDDNNFFVKSKHDCLNSSNYEK